MNKKKLCDFIGDETLRVVEAMEKIDANAHGILFVVDAKKRIVGSLTDGDVRRWLIRTGDLSEQIVKIMNMHPKYLCIEERERAADIMRRKSIKALPIVNTRQRIVDIVFAEEEAAQESEKGALNGVPVIIMAGGKGTRLYPYTKILPKPLIPIGDIPIIERIINGFCEFGVTKYYLTVNYKKGMIKSYFSDLKPAYSLEYVEEEKPLGTAGSLKLISNEFDVPVIVTNCDILVNADYDKLYQYHMESGNALTIVSALKNLVIPYGVLHSKEQGVITEMEEKPRKSYFVNTGMYILNPELLQRIPEDTFYHMTDLAEDLMQEGMKVGMYPVSEDSFLDMGEFEEMRRMERKLNIVQEAEG